MDLCSEHMTCSDEPAHPQLLGAVVAILVRCVKTVIWLPLLLPCLPLFILGLLVWGLPPIVSPWSRFCTYLIATWTEGNKDENIPLTNRILVFLIVLSYMIKAPVYGVCWFIDELLYPSYHNFEPVEPVFFMTGGRSGSTQLANYLEDDRDTFIVPTVVECWSPFIWLWKLGRINSQWKFRNMYGDEGKKYHKSDTSRTDSLDFLVRAWHFVGLSWFLGTSFMRWGFCLVSLEEPIDEWFCNSFLQFTDSIMKKVMYHRGQPGQRVLVKGHFLMAASVINHCYRGVKFFTVVRDPVERLNSTANFIKVMSMDGPQRAEFALFPPSWKVIRNWILQVQTVYCKQEMMFYGQSEDNKLVIPFTMYVNNLCATLQRIYSFCNLPIPDHVVSNAVKAQHTTHDCTKHKASYDSKFQKSLADLGVDESKLKDHLTSYINWMKQFEEKKKDK